MITQSQISEFTRRAKIAGLDDSQIQQEIAKKVAEFNQPNTVSPPATSMKTTGMSQGATETAPAQEEGFISRFVKGIVQPAVDYLKFNGEALYQGGRFVFDPTFRKSVMGGELTPEEIDKLDSQSPTLFYGKDEAQKKLGDVKSIVTTGAKATAGMESYLIPFGKGANIATKALLPGFASGALSEASREDATPESVVKSGVTGSFTAGALEKVGNMISWARGKNGELVRQSEKLNEATRKIKVKASVYGAGKEKAINQTLDKYGFKGTADAQYGMLEPTMKKMEGEIQTAISGNPGLSVTKKEVKDSFMANLKSSLRTKDLTKKEAVTEVEGYITDLLKASGGKGKFTNISIEKLREMKKILNQDYGAVFDKINSGGTLTSREKVISAAWDSLDQAVSKVSPEIKQLLVEESHLYQAAPSLSSARANPPTFRVAGTSVPIGVTQKLRDLGGSTLKTLGIALEKLPENNPLQSDIVQKLAVLTPSALKEKGLSDEEIVKVQDLQGSLKTGTPSGMGTAPTAPAKEPLGLGTKPNPQNPFGNLSKRQVLSLALTQGAGSKDLEEVGKLYDMLSADPNVIDEDAQKAADGLRAEYFKRTNENQFLEASNNYKKVLSTSDNTQGDIALIFAFMKMLDPTSAVREGEYATAEKTASLPAQIVNQYNKIITGKGNLNAEQRIAYKKEASKVYQVYQQRQAPIDAYYQGLAQRYGIDPSLVGVGLFSSGQ